MTEEQHHAIAEYCRDTEVLFLSSVFSPREVCLLDRLGVPAFKVASMDVNHLPLLACVASRHKPVLLSTGMATLGDIERALTVLREDGAGPVALLHCVSSYPTPPGEVNLRNIGTLAHAFDVPVGFSDHTLGTAVPLAAVALGACIIEKHFTLDKAMPGWDHAISADPAEMRALVDGAREIHAALGSPLRTVNESELSRRFDHRNKTSPGHIVTVEDPVEFVHQSQQSLITHREVGIDTHSWHNALKNTLRQAPDVILIGEIRDTETMEHAITFAETGHLCLGTLHSNSANQTLDRIVNFFPEERRKQVLMDLSGNLRAIISQRLVRTVDGKGRKAAVEILLNTPIDCGQAAQGRIPRDQDDHGQVAGARHAHLRPFAVRALQRGRDLAGRGAPQRRLGERAAPQHQAEGPPSGFRRRPFTGAGAKADDEEAEEAA